MTDRLALVPLTLREANAFVAQHHRHSTPTQGCRWATGALLGGKLVGVAIAGRPVARGMDDGLTLEVTRVCTDGTPNACSFLYGAVRRVALLMGYQRIVTYTLATECGASLRACGARPVATTPASQWDRPGRRRKYREVADRVRWQLWPIVTEEDAHAPPP